MSLASRFVRWREPLLSFFMGQPVVQLLNVLTVFLLIRWLDVNEFAMFGIVLAFQSTITQLTDVGFSDSIVALAGSRGQDPGVLGGYLRSARHWRSRLQWGMLLVAGLAFPLIVWRQPWSAPIKGVLFFNIALGLLFQNWNMYGIPLLVHRSLQKYYTPQIFGGMFRLALCAALHAAGLLSAWAAALSASLLLGYTGFSYRRSSQSYIQEPVRSHSEYNSEMLRFLSPIIPTAVFVALQGQVLIGIIAVFGSTQNIAEVSALGRIGQLFVILQAFNNVFIQPYMARVPLSILSRRYLQILGVALGIAAVIATLGLMVPRPFVWLLGKNYCGLQKEIGLVVLNGCLGYLGSVLSTMHSARRWIFWWTTNVYIGSTLFVQILCVATMDLSYTHTVVWFGLICTFIGVVIQIAVGIYGFMSNERK